MSLRRPAASALPLWISAVLVFLTAGPGAAAAQGKAAVRFKEAQRASTALEYDRALTLAQEALEQGDADQTLTRQLYAFQAEMAVAVGLQETAISAYARALAV